MPHPEPPKSAAAPPPLVSVQPADPIVECTHHDIGRKSKMLTNVNPYQSPESITSGNAAEESSLSWGRRQVRLAGTIGLLAPIYECVSFIVSLRHLPRQASLDERDAMVFVAALILLWLAVTWWAAYPIIYMLSAILHFFFGRRFPLAQWQETTDRALWPLPCAAAIGVAVWIAYSLSVGRTGTRAWVNDWVAGVAGHALGAWCYLTIFVAWFRLGRTAQPPGITKP